jgi:Sec-independent protein translocase protein TatA
MFGLGWSEIFVVSVVGLLLFGVLDRWRNDD